MIFFHGNWGLAPPFGAQIQDFAEAVAAAGYLTAVPKYYTDDEPHPFDQATKESILADAIAHVRRRPDADASRLGLVGFSLGAASAMTYIAQQPPGSVGVLVDFYGFLTPTIEGGLGRFPPTAIFHNRDDIVVPFANNSQRLDHKLPGTLHHQLWAYNDHNPPAYHAFKHNGTADVDSRKQATEWLLQYLKPVGV
jgi:carboxymethylenebutenolidase